MIFSLFTDSSRCLPIRLKYKHICTKVSIGAWQGSLEKLHLEPEASAKRNRGLCGRSHLRRGLTRAPAPTHNAPKLTSTPSPKTRATRYTIYCQGQAWSVLQTWGWQYTEAKTGKTKTQNQKQKAKTDNLDEQTTCGIGPRALPTTSWATNNNSGQTQHCGIWFKISSRYVNVRNSIIGKGQVHELIRIDFA